MKIWLLAAVISCGAESGKFEPVESKGPIRKGPDAPAPPAPPAPPGTNPGRTGPPPPGGGGSFPTPAPHPPVDIDPPEPPTEPSPDPDPPDRPPPGIPDLKRDDFYYSPKSYDRYPFCGRLPADYWVRTHHRWWSEIVGHRELCEYYEIRIQYDKCLCRMEHAG